MADIIDMAQAREERERDNALRARALRAQQPSRPAGDPAVCPDCGDPIELARLRIMPNAVRCADCQGAFEQQQDRPR